MFRMDVRAGKRQYKQYTFDSNVGVKKKYL